MPEPLPATNQTLLTCYHASFQCGHAVFCQRRNRTDVKANGGFVQRQIVVAFVTVVGIDLGNKQVTKIIVPRNVWVAFVQKVLKRRIDAIVVNLIVIVIVNVNAIAIFAVVVCLAAGKDDAIAIQIDVVLVASSVLVHPDRVHRMYHDDGRSVFGIDFSFAFLRCPCQQFQQRQLDGAAGISFYAMHSRRMNDGTQFFCVAGKDRHVQRQGAITVHDCHER